jgi:hypothetical protein
LRLQKTVIALVIATFCLALARPAAACAPTGPTCLFAGCWYYLLNDESFNGSTCSPGWVGANVINSNLCTDSIYGTQYKVAQLTSTNSSFTQHFTVPDEAGTMDVALFFATSGTPTSSDRIYVEIWESGVLKETINVRTDLGPFYCHREDFSFTGNYRNKSLDIRVRANIVTSGVSYHIDGVTLFYNV